MLRTVLIWGCIAGAIITGVFFLAILTSDPSEMDFENGELIGYSSMILAFGAGYFGVRQLRSESENWGFGKAFGASMLIVLVGSIIYSAGWTIYAQNNPETVEAMMDHYVEDITSNPDLTEEEIQAELEMTESYAELVKNPAMNFIITLIMEPLLPGLIISLIIGIVLRRPVGAPLDHDEILKE